MDIAHRRSFLLTLPQIALAAACAFGAARGSPSTPTETPATASPASLGGTGSDPHPLDEPAAQERGAAPRQVQPLPLPPEEDRTWLREWLELIALPNRKGALGC